MRVPLGNPACAEAPPSPVVGCFLLCCIPASGPAAAAAPLLHNCLGTNVNTNVNDPTTYLHQSSPDAVLDLVIFLVFAVYPWARSEKPYDPNHHCDDSPGYHWSTGPSSHEHALTPAHPDSPNHCSPSSNSGCSEAHSSLETSTAELPCRLTKSFPPDNS